MIFAFLYSCAFFLNAILILNQERFWNPLISLLTNKQENDKILFNKIIELIDSIRLVMKIPIIIFNILLIIYEILLG